MNMQFPGKDSYVIMYIYSSFDCQGWATSKESLCMAGLIWHINTNQKQK